MTGRDEERGDGVDRAADWPNSDGFCRSPVRPLPNRTALISRHPRRRRSSVTDDASSAVRPSGKTSSRVSGEDVVTSQMLRRLGRPRSAHPKKHVLFTTSQPGAAHTKTSIPPANCLDCHLRFNVEQTTP